MRRHNSCADNPANGCRLLFSEFGVFEILEIYILINLRSGLVVISTHIQPHHSANLPMLTGYKNL
jgi:hypothetical protein